MNTKQKYIFNPITGQFDAITEVDFSDIITHEKNDAGHDLVLWDDVLKKYLSLHFLPVTDNDGNVVSL